MRPALIYDILVDIVPDQVDEAQSLDERPFETGIFVVVRFEEQSFVRGIRRGPRVMTIAVHQPLDESRDYGPLTDLLNEFQKKFEEVENEVGSDGVRVSCLLPQGRGSNDVDEGWRTITRTATYGVLYDESPT